MKQTYRIEDVTPGMVIVMPTVAKAIRMAYYEWFKTKKPMLEFEYEHTFTEKDFGL